MGGTHSDLAHRMQTNHSRMFLDLPHRVLPLCCCCCRRCQIKEWSFAPHTNVFSISMHLFRCKYCKNTCKGMRKGGGAMAMSQTTKKMVSFFARVDMFSSFDITRATDTTCFHFCMCVSHAEIRASSSMFSCASFSFLFLFLHYLISENSSTLNLLISCTLFCN